MIDVDAVLRGMPHFTSFRSVNDLHALAERLGRDSRFSVVVAGRSRRGLPIHHIRFGDGRTKALFLGFPHPNEPIGGLTIHSLLSMLETSHPALVQADVEWHVVPCIDPDATVLNEGWSQQPFSLRNFMRNFHRPEIADQPESAFPIQYKRLSFDKMTPESAVLQRLLKEVRPDLYYSLHNAAAGGGVWYLLSHDIDPQWYEQLAGLLARFELPLRDNPPFEGFSQRFAPGVIEDFSTRKFYDFIAKTSPNPEELMQFGASASDYLHDIKPDAQTFVAELPYLIHPLDTSSTVLPQNTRQLKLHMYADVMFVATTILEEWDRVHADLDDDSDFYKKIHTGLISVQERLGDGLPGWPDKTRDLLFSPVHSRPLTESDHLNVYLKYFFILCQKYEFVRLLRVSRQSAAVKNAIARLDAIFDTCLDDIDTQIGFNKFTVIDHDRLAKVQFASGLIVLNAKLQARG